MSAILTGHTPSETYLDLIHINNGNTGFGVSSLNAVLDGAGNASPLQLCQTLVNIEDGLQLDGVNVTANAADLNLTTFLASVPAYHLCGNNTGSTASFVNFGWTSKFQITSGNLDINQANLNLASIGGTLNSSQLPSGLGSDPMAYTYYGGL